VGTGSREENALKSCQRFRAKWTIRVRKTRAE
jgi:hypothetical protein